MKLEYYDDKCMETGNRMRWINLLPENQDEREYVRELKDSLDRVGYDKWILEDGKYMIDGTHLFGTRFRITDKQPNRVNKCKCKFW